MAILIVDDEEHDIDRLVSYLQAGPGQHQTITYLSSSDEVISEMAKRRKPYRALITDFNMDSFNGKQLLRMVTGKLDGLSTEVTRLDRWDDVAERDLREHLRSTFGSIDRYRAFLEQHGDLVKILHSSNSYGDGQRDLPSDIFFVQKPNAELAILDILCDEGAISPKDAQLARTFGQPDN